MTADFIEQVGQHGCHVSMIMNANIISRQDLKRGIDNEYGGKEYVDDGGGERGESVWSSIIQSIHQAVTDHTNDEQDVRPERPKEGRRRKKV